MVLNLKPSSANYKLCTTNYKEKGTLHDEKKTTLTCPSALAPPGLYNRGPDVPIVKDVVS
jgi:hypothetical protein